MNSSLESSSHSAFKFRPTTNTNTLLFLFFLLAFVIFKTRRDLKILARMREDSYPIKRIGRVEILAHDRLSVPMTFWTLGRATILIPSSLLATPIDYRMSIAHEIQHQRQRDPLWLFALEALRAFAFMNPVAKIWIRKINELQEFACDETLVDRSKVNSQQYARCLFQVAQSTLRPEFATACASGMFLRTERHQLKRRIKMLLTYKKNSMRIRSKLNSPLWARLALFSLLLGTAAYASQGIAQSQSDRMITLDEAKQLARNITGSEGLPVVVNDQVVNELNRYLSSPSSRQGMREALYRMKAKYQSVVDAKLSEYDLPKALDAVPLIESKYENLSARGRLQVAGLWQFIPATARRMGIPVHPGVDERMNIEKLSDAAGRLIKGNALFYNNLGLSLLAFNWGETAVNHWLGATRSRDPWVLSQANNHDRYLPQLMAGMIVIANPKLVE